MAEVRIKAGFTNNLKTKRLLKKVGPEGVYGLINLWLYAAENKKDGDLTGISYDDLSEIAGWRYDPAYFVNSLIEVGFLDKSDKTLAIHDWKEHQGITTTNNTPKKEKPKEERPKTRKVKEVSPQELIEEQVSF